MRWEVIFRGVAAVAIAAGAVVVAGGVWDAYQMAPDAAGLQAMERLGESGVDHPVTAVLLNFRAYDTMLEIVVLTVAFWGVWSLKGTHQAPLSRPPGLLLERVSTVLVPLLIMLAVYLLYVGSHRPGGEFQAGAVLGAAGVLTLLVGRPIPGWRRARTRHLMVVAGAATFLAVAAAGGALTGEMFGYRAGWEPAAMLIIEVAAVVSIGFILSALFAGSAERLSGDVEFRLIQSRAERADSADKDGEGESRDEDEGDRRDT